MPFNCSCGFSTDIGNAYSAHYKHYKGEEHKKLGWTDPETGKVSPTKPRTSSKPVVSSQGGSSKVITGGTVPAGGFVTTNNRPPVIFDLGGELIPLDYQSLYEAYRYYGDFVTEEEVIDDFGKFLLWCTKDVWKRLRTNTRIDSGKIIMEVVHGNHGRSSEEEGGSEQN